MLHFRKYKSQLSFPRTLLETRKKDSADDMAFRFSDQEEDEILYELPDAPRHLPKAQPDWAAMSASSTRFAVAALRKSSKVSLSKCKRIVSTSKESERLESELDRVSRAIKNDIAQVRVPRALLKDRRITALEDVNKSLQQMNKKLKVSQFMENYLLEIRDQRKQTVTDIEKELDKAQAEAADGSGPVYPSTLEIATRANRACPPNFAKPKIKGLAGESARVRDAATAFLFNCRAGGEQ